MRQVCGIAVKTALVYYAKSNQIVMTSRQIHVRVFDVRTIVLVT